MGEITRLLQGPGAAEPGAQEALYALVYAELNQMARQSLAREATCTLLDAPSVVHEAYMRLAQRGDLAFENRRAFFAYAAKVMRNVILGYLREGIADKRGGGRESLTLSTSMEDGALRGTDLVAVDSALRKLAEIDLRCHDLFELHFFGGLGIEDLCAQLELSPATVKRELRKARAYVVQQLDGSPP